MVPPRRAPPRPDPSKPEAPSVPGSPDPEDDDADREYGPDVRGGAMTEEALKRLLKRLEERGLVRRTPDPSDGRASRVTLTRSGLQLQERIFNAFLSASDDLLEGVGAKERSGLDDALRTLLARLEGALAQEAPAP